MIRTKRKQVNKVFCYIALITIALLMLFPMLWGILSSLRSDTELFSYINPFTFHTLIPVEWTVQSWIELFTEYNFLQPFLNSIFVTGTVIIFGCALNSIAAFAFAMFDFRFKKILFSLIFVSFLIPFEAIALPLYQVVDGMSLVDSYQGLILPCIANGLVLFLFVQFFKEIPADLLDAARVDGAGVGKVFTKILVPLSKPIFITAGLMIFVDQWNSHLWPLLVARSKDIRTIQLALAAFTTEHQTKWSALYAGAMFSAMIPLCLFLPLQKYFVQGITSSGVKG